MKPPKMTINEAEDDFPEDVYKPCFICSDNYPENVLEDGCCPSCLDWSEDDD